MIGLQLPEPECLPRVALDQQALPWAVYRKFGVASMNVADFPLGFFK